MTAAALESFSPYSTVEGMITAKPQWMSAYDANRIMSYQIYEQIYWNVPNTFKVTARGTEDNPIYVPTGRTLVDTTNRYVGKGLKFSIDTDYGEAAAQLELQMELTRLFRREKFFSNYNSNKRYGMIRGDWCFHIRGNELKLPGTRLSIDALDPAAYFPVTHPTDPDRIIGAHIVEQFETEDGMLLKRQSYWRGADPIENDGSDTSIWNEIATFNMESWEEFDAQPVTILKPMTQLDARITAIPIYHIKNVTTPGDPWGSSELRGLERIIAAVNQAVSDEELALALSGLGMYWTDAGAPKDSAGNDTDWVLGPARVVEVPDGKKFNRVAGVTTVDPVQSHLSFLMQALKEASSTPDVAIGKVEQAVAESGVSLILQMGPMLSKADEREEDLSGTMDQFIHDIITMWFPVYELIDIDAMCFTAYGQKLPENRKAMLDEIFGMVRDGIASADWARTQLTKYGFVFDGQEGNKVAEEMAAKAAAIDPFSVRAGTELDQDQGA